MQLKDRGYDSVKRWTRKVDIFTLDVITIPIHLGMHWCMAIIDFRGKTVVYYDSFLGSNSKCLNILFDYLHKERRDKKGEEFDSTVLEAYCHILNGIFTSRKLTSSGNHATVEVYHD